MKIKRNIIGERTGSMFGTIEFVLSEKELQDAYEEFVRLCREDGKEPPKVDD